MSPYNTEDYLCEQADSLYSKIQDALIADLMGSESPDITGMSFLAIFTRLPQEDRNRILAQKNEQLAKGIMEYRSLISIVANQALSSIAVDNSNHKANQIPAGALLYLMTVNLDNNSAIYIDLRDVLEPHIHENTRNREERIDAALHELYDWYMLHLLSGRILRLRLSAGKCTKTVYPTRDHDGHYRVDNCDPHRLMECVTEARDAIRAALRKYRANAVRNVPEDIKPHRNVVYRTTASNEAPGQINTGAGVRTMETMSIDCCGFSVVIAKPPQMKNHEAMVQNELDRNVDPPGQSLPEGQSFLDHWYHCCQ